MFESYPLISSIIKMFYFIIPETPYSTRYLLLFGILSALLWYFIPSRFKARLILILSAVFMLIVSSYLYLAIFLTFTIIFYICSAKHFKFKDYVFYPLVGLLLISTFIFTKLTGHFSVYYSFAAYFSAFRIIHYYVDAKQDPTLKKSYTEYLTFLLFFPTLCHGPVERIQNFERQNIKKEDLKFVAKKFVYATIKFMILAHVLLKLEPVKFSFSGLGLWLLLTAYVGAFKLYFLLSADWDVVIALSRLMGYKVIENFPKNPYLQHNLTRFWRNWHWSLVNWLTGYVYIPLGRNKKYLNLKLILVLLIIGWGHLFFNNENIPGIALITYYTLWGVWLGGTLALSKIISQKLNSELIKKYLYTKSKLLSDFVYTDNKPFKILSTFLTFTIISIGWQSPLYWVLISL